MDLPDLGVGVVWFTGLDRLIQASEPLIDFFEVEPATVSLSRGVDATLRPVGPLAELQTRGKPIVVHGVSCPVGGTIAPSDSELTALATAAEFVRAPWVSEHLSFDRIGLDSREIVATGFFLPPVQNDEAVALAATRLRHLRELTGRPVAFETGVNYLRPSRDALDDGEFFAAIAESADCHVLLDLHNVWCNEVNGRQRVDDVIDQLPLDRVCEVHLAGGQDHHGYLLDAHSNLVSPDLAGIALDVVSRLPSLRALTFELIPDYAAPNGIDEAAYRRQLEQLRRIWDARGRAARVEQRRPRRSRRIQHRQHPADAETGLREALAGRPSSHDGDPGIGVYRHLITTLRNGAVVSSLPLTYRLLAFSLGLDGADRTLQRYCETTHPSAWARDEALTFASFLRSHVARVPHLHEVLDFELAAHDALVSGKSVSVRFTCEPTRLLEALRRGVRPAPFVPGSFDVVVDADDQAPA